MNIAYHIFCYIVCFVIAMACVWHGERNTKINAPKNENEFEMRIVVSAVSLLVFIVFHALLTIRTW